MHLALKTLREAMYVFFFFFLVSCIIISIMIVFKYYLTHNFYILFLKYFVMLLSHMLVGIYSTEKNIMEVINAFHIDKAQ
jgi:hypothetical protein